MDLLKVSKTRYTTKAYDPSKKIPKEQFEKLLHILRLAPSSINIQPWHFFIAEDDQAKQRIAKALVGNYAYNAPKVLDSSQTILFCTKVDINEQHLDQLLTQDEKAGRFKDEAAKEAQKNTRLGYVHYYKTEKAILVAGQKIKPLSHLGKCYLPQVLKGLMQHRLVVLMKKLLLKSLV